ncbi:restriction endonuclease subunit S, partial [bacterium]|nr:restriction endonuclease subunit S [bacterium]
LMEMVLVKSWYSGAGVPTLNQNHLHKLKIRIPSCELQKKIAAILWAYDELIKNNKQQIALLEKMAEEIYREWFVRFRFPGNAEAEFVKGMPKDWDVSKLSSILELHYGKALKEDRRITGEFPVYGSSGVVGTHNEMLVKGPGVIVGRKGNVGSVFYSDVDFFPIDTVYYVTSTLPMIFLFFLLKTMNFINNDAAVPGLNRNQALSNKFFKSSRTFINQFADVVQPIFDLKKILHSKIGKLSAVKDQLLLRLISGKLSVESLEIQFPPGMAEEMKGEAAEPKHA